MASEDKKKVVAKKKEKLPVPEKKTAKKVKRSRARNYTPQVKLFAAIMFLIHGSIKKAAEALDIPVRTVQSWAEREEEWSKLLEEAHSQREGFLSSKEKDETWDKIAGHVDNIANISGNVSSRVLVDIYDKLTNPENKSQISSKEMDIAARLFGISVDKAMAIRGIGKDTGGANSFDDFKNRLAERLASYMVNDMKDNKNGDIDLTETSILIPKPPDSTNKG